MEADARRTSDDILRDKTFEQYFREYRHKYPNAMNLDRRAVKTFAGHSTTLAVLIGKGIDGEHYDNALRLYEESKAIVESLERGVAPNYQLGKSEYFRRVYGGQPANEPSLREFVNVRLGEPWRPDIGKQQGEDRMARGREAHEVTVDYSALEEKIMADMTIKHQMMNRVTYPKLTELNDRPPARVPCPECAHTKTPGKYVGLVVIEDCRRCGGKTTIEADAKPEKSSTETKPNPPNVKVMPPAVSDSWRGAIS